MSSDTNTNNPLKPEDAVALLQMVDAGQGTQEESLLAQYASDQTENLFFLPELVLKPSSSEQVAAILRYCNERNIPVTPRGAGTGLSGAALPNRGGVLVSMERMNRILQIDEANLQVITEPGVITQHLQEAVQEKGLFYPPDPASKGSCFIGGNIAHNSGGPKALKYGVVRDYVLNLELVLPSGEVIWTGADVRKNSTGYSLTQLVCGSEGTLGIVTKIVLKLIPFPKYDLLMLVPFHQLEQAGAAVSAVFRAGFTPSALELIEINALKMVAAHLGDSACLTVDDATEAHLLIELDGNDPNRLMEEMEAIAGVLSAYDCGELMLAEDMSQKNQLWLLRRKLAEVLKLNGFTIEEDTVVPRAQLPALIRGVRELAIKYGFDVACYGHAGDGNLHIRIRKEHHPHSLNNPALEPALKALFELVHDLGGTISGEHGIGLLQKKFTDVVFSSTHLQLFRGIKKLFDPNGILNQGKIFD